MQQIIYLKSMTSSMSLDNLSNARKPSLWITAIFLLSKIKRWRMSKIFMISVITFTCHLWGVLCGQAFMHFVNAALAKKCVLSSLRLTLLEATPIWMMGIKSPKNWFNIGWQHRSKSTSTAVSFSQLELLVLRKKRLSNFLKQS